MRELAAEQKGRPQVLFLRPIGGAPNEMGQGEAMMTESGPYYLLKKAAEMLGVDIKAKASLVEV